jgi:hypothetical protein
MAAAYSAPATGRVAGHDASVSWSHSDTGTTTPALDTQLDLLATKAPLLKHPIITCVGMGRYEKGTRVRMGFGRRNVEETLEALGRVMQTLGPSLGRIVVYDQTRI